uniref:BHLH domain-containing protein n=2 Tax=Opuntia streptacantha TaxID=393608 RepID=A0A7C9AV86_OPUST
MASHHVQEDEFDTNWVCCLLEDVPASCDSSFSLDSDVPWPASLLGPLPCSASTCVSIQDCTDETCRKRARCGSIGPTAKACREKIRRDRVNERFLELRAALEPGTKPKCDKTAILTDAIRMVNMLHEETSRLKEQNVKLKEKINELKSEKNELRAEKQRLKADKEDIEKRIKALGAHQPSFQYHPTAMPASYAIPYQRVGTKLVPFMNNPHVSMWQFVPQTVVDTSQDHVLHPPVA